MSMLVREQIASEEMQRSFGAEERDRGHAGFVAGRGGQDHGRDRRISRLSTSLKRKRLVKRLLLREAAKQQSSYGGGSSSTPGGSVNSGSGYFANPCPAGHDVERLGLA